jgi:hypothetical protein
MRNPDMICRNCHYWLENFMKSPFPDLGICRFNPPNPTFAQSVENTWCSQFVFKEGYVQSYESKEAFRKMLEEIQTPA